MRSWTHCDGGVVKLSETDLSGLADLAIRAARDAGEMIARSRPEEIEHKAAAASLASQVVTEIDRRSERIIVDHLTPTLERFDLGLLTEEREDDGGRLIADHFWCVDPLDGTLPFIEAVPGYAVSIALVARDGTSWIGAVHDPVESTTWHAIRGLGAFRDGRRWTPDSREGGNQLSVFTDRSLLEGADHEAVLEALDQIAISSGLDGVEVCSSQGAVMNACGVLTHGPGCYVKPPKPAGGGSLWDFAATACLFLEAGAVATDFHGAPLDLNRADGTSMNHRGVLFATDEKLAHQIRTLHPSPS